MKKTSETYFETIGDDCLTIEINLEVRPVLYSIHIDQSWRTKKDWIAWLDICRDRIDKMP